MNPKATLMVTTYEMPRHLELVLAGVSRQSAHDFELILCDDGSGPETKNIIDAFSAQAPIKVIYVRQEHQGFRKCRLLNMGLRKASGETVIFLDGDCVPHRHFVRDHIENQEEGRYLAGRRVDLGPEISAWLTPDKVRHGFLDFPRPKLILSGLKKDSENVQRSLRLPSALLRRWLGFEKLPDLKGCNYSVKRADLERINGFDEGYEGYGSEDTDTEIRLRNLGLKLKSVKGLAVQFHVWHPRREFTPRNNARLEEARATKRVRCELGLNQL